MEGKDKINAFYEELQLIKDDNIKRFATWAVSVLPDYFFKVAASSTGKFHPKYALGEGGLLRHTKAAVRTANTLLGLEMFYGYSRLRRDAIITALILHDGLKKGSPEKSHTITEHPMAVCAYLEGKFVDEIQGDELNKFPTLVERSGIYSLIKSHMGQWNTDRDGRKVLPLPETGDQNLVHICDYIASRKMFEFNFEAQF